VPGAVPELRRAMMLAPDTQGARGNLAIAYIRAGQPELGLTELRKVLQADPANVTAIYYTAQANKELGRRADAISWVRRALRLSPEDANVKRLLKTLMER
jgi:Tfp pilus assembly protein PilF